MLFIKQQHVININKYHSHQYSLNNNGNILPNDLQFKCVGCDFTISTRCGNKRPTHAVAGDDGRDPIGVDPSAVERVRPNTTATPLLMLSANCYCYLLPLSATAICSELCYLIGLLSAAAICCCCCLAPAIC